ncbi:MAG: RluA family pseudouridine synthase [Candidatus Pelethousia sp.]|nr:RluA family pseudouridine synthase [Candidatus Pelethousia sp.]
MRTRTRLIDAGLAGRRVESLLKEELGISDSLMARLKRRERGICLNGERVYTTARVAVGDWLEVQVGDDPVCRAEPMAYPLSILWEDEDILILNKPAGLAVHASTRNPGELTLENALAAYLPPEDGTHPVSRLDRGTTGAMTWTKNGYMHELLRRQFHTPGFQKEYLAVTAGELADDGGHIRLPIGFAEGSRYKRAIQPEGQEAHTEFFVLARGGGYSLVRLVPHTGRCHQLRLHMATIGYPLAGDWLYGKESSAIARPALHAGGLRLLHPITGDEIRICAPLPEDMKELLEKMHPPDEIMLGGDDAGNLENS